MRWRRTGRVRCGFRPFKPCVEDDDGDHEGRHPVNYASQVRQPTHLNTDPLKPRRRMTEGMMRPSHAGDHRQTRSSQTRPLDARFATLPLRQIVATMKQ